MSMQTRFPARQHGISLLVVLILLLVTSVLGIVVLRSTAMQERMSANMRDRSIAFQATEAALRYAHGRLAVLPDAGDPDRRWDKPSTVPTDAECTTLGICDARDPEDPPVATFQPVPVSEYDAAVLPQAPEYWIEYLGPAPCAIGAGEDTDSAESSESQCPLYRITARSRAAGRAEVMLQANVLSRH